MAFEGLPGMIFNFVALWLISDVYHSEYVMGVLTLFSLRAWARF